MAKEAQINNPKTTRYRRKESKIKSFFRILKADVKYNNNKKHIIHHYDLYV